MLPSIRYEYQKLGKIKKQMSSDEISLGGRKDTSYSRLWRQYISFWKELWISGCCVSRATRKTALSFRVGSIWTHGSVNGLFGASAGRLTVFKRNNLKENLGKYSIDYCTKATDKLHSLKTHLLCSVWMCCERRLYFCIIEINEIICLLFILQCNTFLYLVPYLFNILFLFY